VSATPQVIVDQHDRKRIQTSAEHGLSVEMLGQTIEGLNLPADQCSELVISSQFQFSPVQPAGNSSTIDIYINGKRVHSVRTERPPLNTWGYANPTYVGFRASGGEPFLGKLSRPIILNERVVPDDQVEAIDNGISGVPPTCR